MRTRYRDITEKYKSFRYQHDSLYLSRVIQTLFNKFTKKGKKALARRQTMRALSNFRFTQRRPRTYNILLRILRELHVQFLLLPKRKARKILDVPVPVRRNKRDVLNLQILYNAITRRKERNFTERWEQELATLTIARGQSATLRQRNLQIAKIYEERVYIEERWK